MSAIEVKRGDSESNANLLRRFTKRVQTSGNLRRVRDLKSSKRKLSTLKIKKETLKRLERKATYERLKKLGKIKDVVRK